MNFTMMKRTVSLLLSLLLLASCAAGNAPEETAQTAAPAQQESPPSGDAETEEEDGRICPVPDVTYEGKDFRVVYPSGTGSYCVTDAFAEELTGEVVNDAVYNRNLLMESKFGFRFVPLSEADTENFAMEDYMSGSGGDDVLFGSMANSFPLALRHYYYDWDKLEYVSTDDPW